MSDSTTSGLPLYEGLFLLNQQSLSGDTNAGIEHIREILTRAEAEIVTLARWDERKLAYEIGGQKRGLFVIAYFRVRGPQLPNIDRDCNLSELVLRSLILRVDHVGEVEMQHALQDASASAMETRLRNQAEAEQADRDERDQRERAERIERAKADEADEAESADEREPSATA